MPGWVGSVRIGSVTIPWWAGICGDSSWMRWRRFVVLTAVGVLVVGWQSTFSGDSVSVRPFRAAAASSRTIDMMGSPGWPRPPRVIGTIRAVRPAVDSIVQFRAILVRVYAKACPRVRGARAVFRPYDVHGRDGFESQLVDVHCGIGQARTVRLIYIGVTVPALVGSLAHQTPTIAALLGLRLKLITRAAGSANAGHVIAQHPAPGSIVRFGSTLVVAAAALA
jgi:hypothetical protein